MDTYRYDWNYRTYFVGDKREKIGFLKTQQIRLANNWNLSKFMQMDLTQTQLLR